MCFSNMKQMLPFSVFRFLHEKIKKKKPVSHCPPKQNAFFSFRAGSKFSLKNNNNNNHFF